MDNMLLSYVRDTKFKNLFDHVFKWEVKSA